MTRSGVTGIIVILGICFILSAACSEERSKPSQSQPHQSSFLIGLVPEKSMFKQIERYEPLAGYLSRKTGINVKLTVLSRYENILTSFPAEKMDAAFFGSFSYVLAHDTLGVQVIARPEKLDGKSKYRGLIFVRKDSGITSVRDMRGKRFVFVSKDTTAGFLLPLSYFKRAGVHYKSFLKETYFAGSHEDTILDVLERKADIGAAKSSEFDRLAAANPRVLNELAILATSPEVPENSLAVRKDIDPALRDSVTAALLSMHLDPEGARILREFGARRFVETKHSDFKPVYEYARAAGLKIGAKKAGAQ